MRAAFAVFYSFLCVCGACSFSAREIPPEGAAGNIAVGNTAGPSCQPSSLPELSTGHGSSVPNNLSTDGVRVFFSASSEVFGPDQLWVTDGTSDGTVRLTTFTKSWATPPRIIGFAGQRAIFYADDGTSGLWSTDGTVSGTFPLEISGGQSSADVGGTLFLSSGSMFLRTDGTIAGTMALKDLGEYRRAKRMIAHRDHVLIDVEYYPFAATPSTEVWRSDGTTDGTVLVASYPGYFRLYPAPWGGLLAQHLTSDEGQGIRFVRTDGTPPGTVEFSLPSSAADAQWAAGIGQFANSVLLVVSTVDGTRTLWRTDGTTIGSEMLAVLGQGYPNGSEGLAQQVGARVFYFEGHALWVSDGSSAGTLKLGDVPMPRSSPATYGGKLYWSSRGALWSSDGTTSGTVKVTDTTWDTVLGSDPCTGEIVATSRLLFFPASHRDHGIELWRSDGTAAGTMLLKDLATYRFGTSPQSGVVVEGKLYAGLRSATIGGVYEIDLERRTSRQRWKGDVWDIGLVGRKVMVRSTTEIIALDGAGEAIASVKELSGNCRPTPDKFFNIPGALLFNVCGDGADGRSSYWWTDGTAANTLPLDSGAFVTEVGPPGVTTLFSAGERIWKTDGNLSGTEMITELPRPPGWKTMILNPSPFVQVGPEWLFNYGTYIPYRSGTALWKTDGTSGGTVQVQGFEKASFTTPPTASHGKAYVLTPAEVGIRLWAMDATSAGTEPLHDFAELGTHFAALGDAHVFLARESGGRLGLWKTDGTQGGTGPLDPFVPAVQMMGRVANRVLFLNQSEIEGLELWVTDGTPKGTSLLGDFTPGNSSSNVFLLGVTDRHAYFYASPAGPSATTHTLWRTDGTATGTVSLAEYPGAAFNPVVLAKWGDRFIYEDIDQSGASRLFTTGDCPPSLACPNDLFVEATDDSGAEVTLTGLSALDDLTVTPRLDVSVPLQSRFPVGTTQVTATASDEGGQATTCTFSVTVSKAKKPHAGCASSGGNEASWLGLWALATLAIRSMSIGRHRAFGRPWGA